MVKLYQKSAYKSSKQGGDLVFTFLILLFSTSTLISGCASLEDKQPDVLITVTKSSVLEKKADGQYKVAFSWSDTCKNQKNTKYRLLVKSRGKSENVLVRDSGKNYQELELGRGRYEWAVVCSENEVALSRSLVKPLLIGEVRAKNTEKLNEIFYKNLIPKPGTVFELSGNTVKVQFEWLFSKTRIPSDDEDKGEYVLEVRKLGTSSRQLQRVSSESKTTELQLGSGSYSWALKDPSNGRLFSVPTGFQVKREVSEK